MSLVPKGSKGLCDHWIDAEDRICSRVASQEVTLKTVTYVMGTVMRGTYPAGRWKFCTQHYQSFMKGLDVSGA